ncbi:hypothetical protein ACJX0J_012964 [Zea mays]
MAVFFLFEGEALTPIITCFGYKKLTCYINFEAQAVIVGFNFEDNRAKGFSEIYHTTYKLVNKRNIEGERNTNAAQVKIEDLKDEVNHWMLSEIHAYKNREGLSFTAFKESASQESQRSIMRPSLPSPSGL